MLVISILKIKIFDEFENFKGKTLVNLYYTKLKQNKNLNGLNGRHL